MGAVPDRISFNEAVGSGPWLCAGAEDPGDRNPPLAPELSCGLRDFICWDLHAVETRCHGCGSKLYFSYAYPRYAFPLIPKHVLTQTELHCTQQSGSDGPGRLRVPASELRS